MFSFVYFIFASVFVCEGIAAAPPDCHYCVGTVTLTLLNGADFSANQEPILKQIIAACSAALDSVLTPQAPLNCQNGKCLSFAVKLRTKRFCGFGPVAKSTRDVSCKTKGYQGSCILLYDLTCSKDVYCLDFNCKNCHG